MFTTRTGHPIEPRNINRAFDVRCARYGVRRIALTMVIYSQVPDKVARDALRRLSNWLDHDEDQGGEASS